MSHGARLCLKVAERLRTISWKGQGAEFLDTALRNVYAFYIRPSLDKNKSRH